VTWPGLQVRPTYAAGPWLGGGAFDLSVVVICAAALPAFSAVYSNYRPLVARNDTRPACHGIQ